MARLQDKVAFITGAGSGIARAAARLFAQEGARVVIAELKPELGRISEQAVRDIGGEAAFIETDVTKKRASKIRFSRPSSGLANLTFCITAPAVRSCRMHR